jgi:hypothetical protein
MFKKQATIYVATIPGMDEPERWHRTFIAALVGILIMTLVTLIVGCSSQECPDRRRFAYDFPPAVSPKLMLRSPAEASVDPQAFAYRSDWPSTTGDVDLGQLTTYQGYWYDRQSLVPGVPDTSYSLFQMYRYGTSVR